VDGFPQISSGNLSVGCLTGEPFWVSTDYRSTITRGCVAGPAVNNDSSMSDNGDNSFTDRYSVLDLQALDHLRMREVVLDSERSRTASAMFRRKVARCLCAFGSSDRP
jgi:hypothetical protein